MHLFSGRIIRSLFGIHSFAAISVATGPVAEAQTTPNQGGAAWSISLPGPAPDAVIRLTLRNIGGKTLHGESIAVPPASPCPPLPPPCPDPPIQRTYWSLDPGSARTDEFKLAGWSNPVSIQARLQLDAPLIDALAPSAEIVDSATGKVLQLVDTAGFVMIQPIFTPPFLEVF